ncbi:RHS repeat-associated core domain-containing protein [Aquimarina longa]|uniref:RHS repeat-associated core domain-containing protein n=1 Tax=Aquimarina longa TaxID=1080221 RepID=UPI000AF867E3
MYNYKDHLGNTRLSYTKNDAGTLEIVEESNYYPFGLTHKGYNSSVSSLGNSTAQLLKFGGKEQQDELGLDWIDITARNYDPALGRWMNLDPLAENMRRHSPYNYAFDNPIYYIDPDGMVSMAFDWINNGDGTYTAQAGDSAATLSEDAGISLEEADKIVQSQLGENYEGEDGEMKSDVEVGDVVAVPEQVENIKEEKDKEILDKISERKVEIQEQIRVEDSKENIEKLDNSIDSLSKEIKKSNKLFHSFKGMREISKLERGIDKGYKGAKAGYHDGMARTEGDSVRNVKKRKTLIKKRDSIKKSIAN